MKHIKKHYDIYVYATFAVFYFWLAAQIPYTHDDWAWGLPVGMQQWITASVNGRYVGNFLEVVMTRSEVLKTVIIGSGFFLLPFISSALVFSGKEDASQKDGLLGFIFCNVLLLSMRPSVWQQTYGWVAGYANFGVSSISLLLVMKQLTHTFDDPSSNPRGSFSRSLVLFLICLFGQLFIENISIYVFLSSLLLNVLYWYKARRFSWEYLSIFFASLIGLVLIFSSSIYATLWSTGEAVNGYRRILITSETTIKTFLSNFIYHIVHLANNTYAKNLSVCMAIIILMSFLLMQQKLTNTRLNKVLLIGNILVAICLLLSQFAGIIIGTLASALFFIAVFVELFLLFKKQKALLHKLHFIWISPVCLIFPLAFTTELGARIFFTSNSILIFFALFILRICLKSMPKKAYFSVILYALVCVLLVHYGTVYYAIGKCTAQRNAIIENAIQEGADTIVLPQYPHLKYLWFPNPNSLKKEAAFKDFYKIPQDVSIVFNE